MPRPARVLELRLCTPHGRGVVSPTRLPTTASIAFHSATASIAVYLDATAAEGSLAHHLPVSAVRCVELSLLPLTTHPTGGLPRAALWVEAAPCEWLPHGGLLSLHITVDGLVACGVWDALEGVSPPSSVGFPDNYLTAVPWVYSAGPPPPCATPVGGPAAAAAAARAGHAGEAAVRRGRPDARLPRAAPAADNGAGACEPGGGIRGGRGHCVVWPCVRSRVAAGGVGGRRGGSGRQCCGAHCQRRRGSGGAVCHRCHRGSGAPYAMLAKPRQR